MAWSHQEARRFTTSEGGTLMSWKDDRIGACLRGENPALMTRMKSGFAVIGDNQFLPGYCVLLRYPQASSLNELSLAERSQYLLDTTLIGDAILRVCQPQRINYMTLMNYDHYLHTHIEARYDWEPEEYKIRPSFFYPKELRYQPQYDFAQEPYRTLKGQLTKALLAVMEEAGHRHANAQSPFPYVVKNHYRCRVGRTLTTTCCGCKTIKKCTNPACLLHFVLENYGASVILQDVALIDIAHHWGCAGRRVRSWLPRYGPGFPN